MNKNFFTNRFKYLFYSSFVLNIIVAAFIANHYYKVHLEIQQENSGGKTYAFNRQTVYELFPVNESDIVFAGDSHTQRFDTQEYLPGFRIVNRGIDSDISGGLLNRLDQFTKGHPAMVFIEIGFNDLRFKISPDSICKNIESIINQIHRQSPKTKIYLNNIFPCSVELLGVDMKPLIPVLNKKLFDLSAKYSIKLIDINSKLSDNGSLNKLYDCGDGIHLNGKGYAVWSNLLKSYL